MCCPSGVEIDSAYGMCYGACVFVQIGRYACRYNNRRCNGAYVGRDALG